MMKWPWTWLWRRNPTIKKLTPEQTEAQRRADEIRVQMLRVEAEARRVAARVMQRKDAGT